MENYFTRLIKAQDAVSKNESIKKTFPEILDQTEAKIKAEKAMNVYRSQFKEGELEEIESKLIKD
jgi:hypothetical protein